MLRITVLGSGTSQGIPVIACECAVCSSADPKDNRLRCSVLIEGDKENYVIDAGPDFRQQMLREKVKSLHGVIFTHEHKDHVAGLDDVRAFNYRENRDMELFCTDRVAEALKREYQYAFEENRYPGIPELSLNLIENEPFRLPDGLLIEPIEVMHYRMPVLGFRIKDLAYITDAKTISDNEMKKLEGVRFLIINALRKEPHLSHLNESEALELIEKIRPEKAWLTHISHLYGRHADIESGLPENVFAAYDGLKIEIE